MKIHVTGADGFLATYVMQTLTQIADVQGSDVGTMDVTDADSARDTLAQNPPDILVHLAALQGNAASRERPVDFFNVNALGTLNLLEACRGLGIKRFILMSSVTVHGMSETPVDELSPIRPLHPYGASKAAAEAYVQAYATSYGMRNTVLRPNFIAGPTPPSYKDNMIRGFIDDLVTNGGITLAGHGAYQREWIHPQDIADAIQLVALSEAEGCETFILSEEANRLDMRSLAQRIIDRVGDIPGKVTTLPELPGFTLISSATKAKETLHWQPKRDIDSIIDEIWHGYRSN